MTIDNYLDNVFNRDVYKFIKSYSPKSEKTEPLFFLDLLHRELEYAITNADSPIATIEKLFKVELPDPLRLHFLSYLGSKLFYEAFEIREADRPKAKQLNNLRKLIDQELKELGLQVIMGESGFETLVPQVDFESHKTYLSRMETDQERIEYLLDIKTDYLQKNNPHLDLDEVPFDQKCDLEISRLSSKEDETKNLQSNSQLFSLSDKTGAKVNIIRILNALFELKLIVKRDGSYPSKKEFMQGMGDMLGTNLASYDSSLSQSLRNQRLEVNLKVFEDMIDIVKSQHSDSKQ